MISQNFIILLNYPCVILYTLLEVVYIYSLTFIACILYDFKFTRLKTVWEKTHITLDIRNGDIVDVPDENILETIKRRCL